MKTIVALIDFNDSASKILGHAKNLATAFKSQIILLHVVPPEPVVASYGAELPVIPLPGSLELLRADKARLDDLVVSLESQGVNVRALQFNGPIAETALAEIPRLGADLAIMGAHHHSAIYNFFIGSVTTDVLKAATFPVLVVPHEAPAETPAA